MFLDEQHDEDRQKCQEPRQLAYRLDDPDPLTIEMNHFHRIIVEEDCISLKPYHGCGGHHRQKAEHGSLFVIYPHFSHKRCRMGERSLTGRINFIKPTGNLIACQRIDIMRQEFPEDYHI